MPHELPIIMGAESVKAILEGRKTETRRLIDLRSDIDWQFTADMVDGSYRFEHGKNPIDACCFRKPRYQAGDLLWCKETHARWSNNHSSIIYSDDSEYPLLGKQNVALNALRASSKTAELMEPVGFWQKVSPYFMHKKEARLWLRVTALKDPHQIQTISEQDIKAEGILCEKKGLARSDFRCLWNRLHPKPGERFEDSPWVFPYVFERIER